MSYDIRIAVKVEGLKDKYVTIATPELDSPTYNLGKMFRACMNWDFCQSYQDENGDYHAKYYNCKDIIPDVNKGIEELIMNREKYKEMEPDNHWGTVDDALNVLRSLENCIYYTSRDQDIPLEYLYMRW